MSFRRALALAACGLAGGSVLFSAVAVGKQPARGGDAEPRPGGSAAAAAVPPASAAPPGLLLLPPAAAAAAAAASCPPAPGWIERPAGSGGYWDSNWDRWVRWRGLPPPPGRGRGTPLLGGGGG